MTDLELKEATERAGANAASVFPALVSQAQDFLALVADYEETKAYWEECQTEHHKRNLEVQNLKADAERDYKDMRRFQRQYIQADHERIDLKAEVERLRAVETAYASMGEIVDSMASHIDAALALISTKRACVSQETEAVMTEIVKALKGGE